MTNKQSRLGQILAWLDSHLLLILTAFLMAFIPLYPKLPLFEALPGYIVRVRLEDLLVLLAAVAWLVQALRKKVEWRSIIFWLIAAYAVVGLLSVLSAVFLINTIPLETLHVGKTVLHYFRYLEYFVLFVVAFSAVKSKQDIKTLIIVFALTVIAVTAYGYGQKYYYLPVYSTMNREFSKGIRLYLTEHARIQSTFAGHYDLAAYLVIALCMMLAVAYKHQAWWKKVFYHLVHLIGLWLLIMTASRTSFVSYLFGASVVIFLVAKEQQNFWKQLGWGLKRFISLILIIVVMMASFGASMFDRFLHVLEGYPQVTTAYEKAKTIKDETSQQVLIALGIEENEEGKRGRRPDNALSMDEAERDVVTDSDERPSTEKPKDVYVDVPDRVRVATKSADGSTDYVIQEKPRTWSENAMKYGLSTAIRLDTLWPNAIQGFKRNPLLGSGYATLNKEGPHHFTEAESTDNNYLRILGETGLLGFISFFSIIGAGLYFAVKFHQVDRTFTSAISVGFIGATMGLLLNATYIDVFAASKVAFTYWSLTGIVVGLFYLERNKSKLQQIEGVKKARSFFSSISSKLLPSRRSKYQDKN